MTATNPLNAMTSALAPRYEVVEEIGRGGMAVVYLARDVRHQRRVAVKVLNADLAAMIGSERFLAEIRITANLQHPNLLPLFDSGEVNGVPYYVMPYVEGESLRAKLERERQLPVDESVRLAAKLAGALDHAHRHNVVHRDLKPENILLRDGEPFIADFGIALALSNAGGNRLTQTGLSVGTPQYMSPEQASAERSIDGRTDIYALGAVLYEMLTGEPPHTGPTAQAVLAKVVVEAPRSTRLARQTIPGGVDTAVLRALAKIPADRWATAHEFADALDRGLADRGDGARALVASSNSGARMRAAIPIAAALAVGAAGTYAMTRGNGVAPAASYQYILTLPESAAVSTGYGGSGGDIAISRDGRVVVYVAGPTTGGDIARGIWTRRLDELTARPIPGIRTGTSPRVSPDGARLLYSTDDAILLVPMAGGVPTRVASTSASYDWIDSRSIVYTRGPTIWVSQQRTSPELRIGSVDDTTSRRLVGADSARRIIGVAFPNVLPGGRRALVTIWKGVRGNAEAQLAIVSLTDGTLTELGIQGSNPRYSRGHILFVKADEGLYAVPFDPDAGSVSGSAWQVAPQVLVKLSGRADFDVSDDGTLVYVGGSDFHRRLVLVDRNGVARALQAEVRRYFTPRVSPDGRRIAVEVGTMDGFDIWSYDVTSRTFGAVTRDGRSIRPGGWTADGSGIVHLRMDSTFDSDVIAQPLDGRGVARTIIPATRAAADVSLSSQSLALRTTDSEIAISSLAQPLASRVVVPRSSRAGVMRLSRDGQMLAYEVRGGEPIEVFARSLDDGTQIQVSTGGGREPAWSPSGEQVFYRGGAYLIAASIGRSPLRVLRRDTLFRDAFVRGAIATNYDVMPNGQFVMIQNDNSDVHPTVIVNWLQRPK